VAVELVYELQAVCLRVTDDGRGFITEEAPGHAIGHFGLIGMRERTRKIAGRFRLESRPGAGTRIEIRIEDTRANGRMRPRPEPVMSEQS
jgi:signal transduction histidine kinase